MSKKNKQFKMDEEQSLIPVGPNVGQHLIKEALAKFEDAQKKRIIQAVSDIMERISLMKRIQSKTQKRLVLLEDQMKALDEGKFKIIDVSMSGVPGQATQYGIKFIDESLNIDWSATERW